MKSQPDLVKDVAIKIKSLQQKIRPISIGAGATRPEVYVIFDKEAAAQFTRSTMVYLSWVHQGLRKVRGYNVFTQVSKKPNCWKINLPQSMLREGLVIARIELVDSRSIAASRDFEINVLYNPNGEENFTSSDDYSLFQEAILELTKKIEDTQKTVEDTKQTIKDLNDLFDQVQEFYDIILAEREAQNQKIDSALETANQSLALAMQALNQLVWGEIE